MELTRDIKDADSLTEALRLNREESYKKYAAILMGVMSESLDTYAKMLVEIVKQSSCPEEVAMLTYMVTRALYDNGIITPDGGTEHAK